MWIHFKSFSLIGLHIGLIPLKLTYALSSYLSAWGWGSMSACGLLTMTREWREPWKNANQSRKNTNTVSHAKWIHHFKENLGFFTLVTHCLFHDRTLWEDKEWLPSAPKKWEVFYFRCCFPNNILPLNFYHPVSCQICMSLVSDTRASTMALFNLDK